MSKSVGGEQDIVEFVWIVEILHDKSFPYIIRREQTPLFHICI